MHAPEDPDLRLALLLTWALHAEAERLAREHEEAPPPTRR
jgi:hypothetical protein